MTYVGGHDRVTSRLNHLSRACAQVVIADGGSVALVSTVGGRVLRSATDDLALALEESQIALGEGPYVEAGSSLIPVLVPDLTDEQSATRQRWPFFAREAERLDVRAMFAFPIRVSAVAIGTFGLYRRAPGDLATRQIARALQTVDEIKAALLDADDTVGAVTGADGHGDGSTAQVHQAAGMVMLQADVTILEAMALLRAAAFADGLSLPVLAREVVQRRRRVGKGDPG